MTSNEYSKFSEFVYEISIELIDMGRLNFPDIFHLHYDLSRPVTLKNITNKKRIF